MLVLKLITMACLCVLAHGQQGSCLPSQHVEILSELSSCSQSRCDPFIPVTVSIEVQDAEMVTFHYVMEGGFENEDPQPAQGSGWVFVQSSFSGKVVKVVIVIIWLAGSSQQYQNVHMSACFDDSKCALQGCEQENCSCPCNGSKCECPVVYLELKSIVQCAVVVIGWAQAQVEALTFIITQAQAIVRVQALAAAFANAAACAVADATAVAVTSVELFASAFAVLGPDITISGTAPCKCRPEFVTEVILTSDRAKFINIDKSFTGKVKKVRYPLNTVISANMGEGPDKPSFGVNLTEPYVITRIEIDVFGVESVNFSVPGFHLVKVIPQADRTEFFTAVLEFENCTLQQYFVLIFTYDPQFDIIQVKNLRLFVCRIACIAKAAVGMYAAACARADAAALALAAARAQAEATAQAKAVAIAVSKAEAIAAAVATAAADATAKAFAAIWAVIDVDCNGVTVSKAAVITIKDVDAKVKVAAAVAAIAAARTEVGVAVGAAASAKARAEAFAFAAAFASARAQAQSILVARVIALCGIIVG